MLNNSEFSCTTIYYTIVILVKFSRKLMYISQFFTQKKYLRFLLMWLAATSGYVLIQEALPNAIGTSVGALYNTQLGLKILDYSVLDFLFSASVWSFYIGVLLAFLILVFTSFFYTLLNTFALFEKHFEMTDTLRTARRLFPIGVTFALVTTVLAALTGTLERIIPSPFSANILTNCLFSALLSLSAFFTTADVISGSLKDAVLNTARLLREYWQVFLLFLFSCTLLISLLGWWLLTNASPSIWLQLLLSGVGFLFYGIISGMLFDFFIRHKDPFLLNEQPVNLS